MPQKLLTEHQFAGQSASYNRNVKPALPHLLAGCQDDRQILHAMKRP